MKYKYKKQLTKIKRIFQNPGDFKYLNVNKKVKQSGMLLVIHESVSYTHLDVYKRQEAYSDSDFVVIAAPTMSTQQTILT